MSEPVKTPFTRADVPPGSHLRRGTEVHSIAVIHARGVILSYESMSLSWADLAECEWEILPPGADPVMGWRPCYFLKTET